MNNSLKEESVKEMLQMLKGDYNFPVKLWVWGKVVKEWAGIIVGSAIFLLVALYIVFSIKGERQNTTSQQVPLPIKEIVTLLGISQRSINTRQEIFEDLMKTVESDENKKLDKESLEQKIKGLSLSAKLCNTMRGVILNEFTEAKNPFENPKVLATFNKLIEIRDDLLRKNEQVLNSQRESEEWGKLCALCQDEVKKANNELVQFLNEEGKAQITSKLGEVSN